MVLVMRLVEVVSDCVGTTGRPDALGAQVLLGSLNPPNLGSSQTRVNLSSVIRPIKAMLGLRSGKPVELPPSRLGLAA